MLRLESVIKGDDFFSLIELRKQRGAEAIALKSQLDTTLSAYFSESSQLLAARINTMFTSARGARRLFPAPPNLRAPPRNLPEKQFPVAALSISISKNLRTSKANITRRPCKHFHNVNKEAGPFKWGHFIQIDSASGGRGAVVKSNWLETNSAARNKE